MIFSAGLYSSQAMTARASLLLATGWALMTSLGVCSKAIADTWLSAPTAELQTLDKITARIDTLTLAVDEPVRFGTLEITLRHCAYRPPEEPPEHAAFLELRDLGYEHTDGEMIFSGWMFASSPAISALEHPVYDVSVTACIKD